MINSISIKNLKQFGFIISFGVPLIIGWLFPLMTGHNFRVWTLFVGIPFLIITFLNPKLLKIPYKVWMKLGEVLGWVNSKIILGSIFIFILFPISIIMRASGYDPLRNKFNNKSSYRENKKNYIIDLTRIF
tara:strand:- start:115 stop:507 length:393 start_codon:yes stop_codon:yes gene_type:complete